MLYYDSLYNAVWQIGAPPNVGVWVNTRYDVYKAELRQEERLYTRTCQYQEIWQAYYVQYDDCDVEVWRVEYGFPEKNLKPPVEEQEWLPQGKPQWHKIEWLRWYWEPLTYPYYFAGPREG